MAKRKQATPKPKSRPTNELRRLTAQKAWRRMKKTEDGKNVDVKTVLLHPHWRKLFVYYCSIEGKWSSDTLDNWEYEHFQALMDLNEEGVL